MEFLWIFVVFDLWIKKQHKTYSNIRSLDFLRLLTLLALSLLKIVTARYNSPEAWPASDWPRALTYWPLIGHTRALLSPDVGKTDGQNNKRGETVISVSSITLIGEYGKFQILQKRTKLCFFISPNRNKNSTTPVWFNLCHLQISWLKCRPKKLLECPKLWTSQEFLTSSWGRDCPTVMRSSSSRRARMSHSRWLWFKSH